MTDINTTTESTDLEIVDACPCEELDATDSSEPSFATVLAQSALIFATSAAATVAGMAITSAVLESASSKIEQFRIRRNAKRFEKAKAAEELSETEVPVEKTPVTKTKK